MENKICLDTDFLVDLLNSKPYAVDFVKNAEKNSKIGVSIITIFELYYGAYLHNNAKQLKLIEALQAELNILGMGHETAREAGRVSALLQKSGQIIEFKDILIGVSAKNNGYSLKTKNIKHFSRIDGLRLA